MCLESAGQSTQAWGYLLAARFRKHCLPRSPGTPSLQPGVPQRVREGRGKAAEPQSAAPGSAAAGTGGPFLCTLHKEPCVRGAWRGPPWGLCHRTEVQHLGRGATREPPTASKPEGTNMGTSPRVKGACARLRPALPISPGMSHPQSPAAPPSLGELGQLVLLVGARPAGPCACSRPLQVWACRGSPRRVGRSRGTPPPPQPEGAPFPYTLLPVFGRVSGPQDR